MLRKIKSWIHSFTYEAGETNVFLDRNLKSVEIRHSGTGKSVPEVTYHAKIIYLRFQKIN